MGNEQLADHLHRDHHLRWRRSRQLGLQRPQAGGVQHQHRADDRNVAAGLAWRSALSISQKHEKGWLAALPVSANGKLDRAAIRAAHGQ